MTATVPPDNRARRWDASYSARGADAVSWYQPLPEVSLQLIELLDPTPDRGIVDVGGGASRLVDDLLQQGRSDLTVVDISETALDMGRRRVTDAVVNWVRADILTWRPDRRFDLWHDRAMFHFLVSRADESAYLRTLDAVLSPTGFVIIGTFAQDGPDRCSGLPVARYSLDELAAKVGAAYEVVASLREEHTTPRGNVQPFTWIALRRLRG